MRSRNVLSSKPHLAGAADSSSALTGAAPMRSCPSAAWVWALSFGCQQAVDHAVNSPIGLFKVDVRVCLFVCVVCVWCVCVVYVCVRVRV